MKRLLFILALLFVACNSSKTTDTILAEVWEKDQSIRLRMMELTKAISVDGRTDLIDSLVSVVDYQQRIDEENMAVVDSLLQRGLPAGLSAESYKTIWIVIDHASLEKQEQYLPIVEQMSLDGLIDKDEYNETMIYLEQIKSEALEFVEDYIAHMKGKKLLHPREYKRRYSFSPLQYFHSEMGI